MGNRIPLRWDAKRDRDAGVKAVDGGWLVCEEGGAISENAWVERESLLRSAGRTYVDDSTK